MLKNLLFAIMLMGLVPALADAWTLTAKLSTASGTLTCEGQTLTSGLSYITVPNTNASTTVTIQPNPGYKINLVMLDNVNVAQPGVNVYTVNYAGVNHTLTVYFTALTYSVSLTQASGGTITAQKVLPTVGSYTQTGLTGVAYGSTVEITASPLGGNLVKSLSSTSDLGTVSHFSGASYTPQKYRFLVDRNISFTSSYGVVPQVTARVIASTTRTTTNTPVVLDASSSTTNDPPLSFSYSVISGDPSRVSFTPITPGSTAAVSFEATGAGDYQVRVTATSAGGGIGEVTAASINVTSPGAFASEACTSCHANRDAGITGGYLASTHAAQSPAISCSSCHNPGATLPHPYDPAPIASCRGCHTSFSPAATGHESQVGSDRCTSCHDPHSSGAVRFIGVQVPHYNNITTAGYPASYVSSRSVCADCHRSVSGPSLDAIRNSWAGSGHADVLSAGWRGADFKTQDGCVRCHTRTGFLSYSTGKVSAAWGAPSDKTKEVLSCNGCHQADFSLRVLAPYSSATAFSFKVDQANSVSVPYKNLDYGGSNLCITCHGGTTSGEIIKLAFAFANFTAAGRLQNHFMAGGGVMDNSIGYEFDGTPGGRILDFNKQNTWHSGIGLPSAQYNTGNSGPCVTCHMNTPDSGHSFAAVFKNLTGSITQVTAAAVCAKCHPSQLGGGELMTAQALTLRKSGFASGLAALKGELKARGFDPDAQATIGSWGGSALARANNMGSFYNYLLLSRNDLAAYVHNPIYARRLIQYSIDWLDNGLFDDSDYTSINMLNLPQATKDAAISYLGVSFSGTTPNCFSCHQSYYD